MFHSGVGSGFRFAAEAFAKVIGQRDFTAVDCAARASLDNAPTLEARRAAPAPGRPVAVATLG